MGQIITCFILSRAVNLLPLQVLEYYEDYLYHYIIIIIIAICCFRRISDYKQMWMVTISRTTEKVWIKPTDLKALNYVLRVL